jgi:hypothetical protein
LNFIDETGVHPMWSDVRFFYAGSCSGAIFFVAFQAEKM